MKRTVFQHPELRDANDNIIQQGAFGKNTALANSTNDGWIDYVANDLEALYDITMGGTGGEINTETITGKTGTITNLTATTVKAGTLTADALNGPLTGDVTGNVTGDVTGNLTGNVTGTADKAVADGKGNNIVNTYVTKSDLSSSVSTTSLTVSGETSVPTANTGNSSKAIANTEYVQGELTNYLPLSGGTLTGVVNGVTPPNGDNSKKLATTEFVNAKAGKYLPLSGGTMFGWLSANQNEFRIRNSKAEHDGAVSVFGGDVATTGANLYLYGTSRSSQAGSFVLSATDGANTKSLRGQADGTLTWNSQPLLPVVGIVQAFAGTTIPNGWLLCDGAAVSRTLYATLFNVIGTTYGAGNGSTTFNLPNLVDKFVEGSTTAGTVKSAGLPNITGTLLGSGSYTINNATYFTGAFSYTNAVNSKTYGSDERNEKWNSAADFNASRSSSIYGNSTTVQPPALTMRYIIKY